MRNTICIVLLALGWTSLGSAQLPPPTGNARLVCEKKSVVKHPLRPDPVRVDNLHAIEIQATMLFSKEIGGEEANAARLDPINDQGCPDCAKVRTPNLILHLYRRSGSERIPVAFQVFSSGGVVGGADTGDRNVGYQESVLMDLRIPNTEAQRRNDFQAFIARLRKQGDDAAADGFERLLKVAEQSGQTNTIFDYLDRENQPGTYEVICEFQPQEWTYWKQPLRSAPLTIEVAFRDKWFNVLAEASKQKGGETCHSIVLTGELSSGNHFEKEIGRGLVLRLNPQRLGPKGELEGWRMTLVPSGRRNDDYIYPANPPLRFNGAQILGPSYGDDTKTSLGHPHEMRFLLYPADYDRISPLVTNALWPYNAPHPDNAAAEYLGALKTLMTGQLKLTVKAYDADPVTGSIRHINFQAELTAPENFEFDPALKPERVRCSTSTGQKVEFTLRPAKKAHLLGEPVSPALFSASLLAQSSSETYPYDPVVTPSIVGLLVRQSQAFRLAGPDGRPIHDVEWHVSDTKVLHLSSGVEATVTGLQPGTATLTAEFSGGTAEAEVTVYEGEQLPIGVSRWKVKPLPGNQAGGLGFGDPQGPEQPDIYGHESTEDGSILLRAFTGDGRELWRTFVTKGTGKRPSKQPGTSQPAALVTENSFRAACGKIQPTMSKEKVAAALTNAGAEVDAEKLPRNRWVVEQGTSSCVVMFRGDGTVERARFVIGN